MQKLALYKQNVWWNQDIFTIYYLAQWRQSATPSPRTRQISPWKQGKD